MELVAITRRIAALTLVISISACATAEPGADLSATDRNQGFNRAMLDFNMALDRNVLRPVSQGYDFVTPTLVKHLLGNGFSHLDLPADFVNYLLQGEINLALETLGRFTLNTVMGAGGLLDPATEFGLPKKNTDFGVTLGKHGVSEGDYWVLPIVGPKTTRDAFGGIVDLAMSPTTYIRFVAPAVSPEAGIALAVGEKIHERDANDEFIDELLYKSPDPYISLRSVYLQHRRALVAGKDAGADALPDIFDNIAN